MKFTLSWLKEHLNTNASVDEISETLTRIGLEVEEVVNPASQLDGFITAKVESVEMHPDSDHLHIFNRKQRTRKISGSVRSSKC